jgi:hemerythrin
MATFKWDRRLETGIRLIDEQHRELFKRIDALELAIYNTRATAELVDLIKYLEEYVIEHFDAEEVILTDFFYPDFPKHLFEHNEFRKLYNEMKEECRTRGPDAYLAIDVDKLIRKWWENHIMKSDMDFVPYVKKVSGT